MSDSRRSRQYTRWKEAFRITADAFEKDAPLKASKRIKVAILDSGLDKEHVDIWSAQERIRVFDRLERDPRKPKFKKLENIAISDSLGHGTHVVGLVLEYTLDAELYVADVNLDKQPDRERVAEVSINATIHYNSCLLSSGYYVCG